MLWSRNIFAGWLNILSTTLKVFNIEYYLNEDNHILELVSQALGDLVKAVDENVQREQEEAKYVAIHTCIHACVTHFGRRIKRQQDLEDRKTRADRKQSLLASARSSNHQSPQSSHSPFARSPRGSDGDEEDGQIFDGILHQAKVCLALPANVFLSMLTPACM